MEQDYKEREYIAQALHSLRPGSTWAVRGDTYEDIDNFSDGDKDIPTKSEVEAEVARLKSEYDAQEYARKRQVEYPSINDLVVALYDTDDKSAIEAKRAAVKAKYPKPS